MKIERVYVEVTEHPTEKGFYKHPYLDIWLSKGNDQILTPDGFVEPACGGTYKSFGKYHLHVLKLETFLQKPALKAIKILGNHIDGDKHNNELRNLEWVTTSGNLIHAVQNGLRSDNRRGFLIDLETGKLKSFSSLRELSSYLGVSTGSLTNYLKSSRSYPIKFKYAIRLKGEPKPLLTIKDVGRLALNSPVPYVLTNQHTNEIKYFACGKSVTLFFGLAGREGERVVYKKQHGDWVIKQASTYDEYVRCVESDGYYKSLSDKKRQNLKKLRPEMPVRRVRVTNHLTNTTSEFESVREFSKRHAFSIGEINRALKTKLSWREFTFEFLE